MSSRSGQRITRSTHIPIVTPWAGLMTWELSAGKGARSFCARRQSNRRSELPAGAKLGPAHKLARDKKLSFVRAGVNACGGIVSALRPSQAGLESGRGAPLFYVQIGRAS